MSELGVFAFCAAMGFASSATICTFYEWVTAQRADFSVQRQSPAAIAIAILVSMFAGPFIVVQKVIEGLRQRELQALPAMLGVIVAGVWSVCAGIFYLSFLVGA